jgi:hypothetical protein
MSIGTSETTPTRRGRTAARIGLATLVLGAVTTLGASAWGPAGPAVAQEGGGCDNAVNGQTCGATGGHGGRVVDLSGEVAPHVSSAPKVCLSGIRGEWIDYGPPFPGQDDFDPGPPPQEGARYWVFVCPNHLNGVNNPVNWEGAGWGLTPPETPPTPADVLPALWEAVQARLQNPQVTLTPDEADRAVLNVPTFVEIENPQYATRYTATAANGAGSVTVWIDVDPDTTLHPGETGASAVPCDEDGSTFVAGGGSPDAQAEGACAWTYVHRNANGWDGDVTITWTVTWGATVAGQGGGLDAAPTASPFDRVVNEVFTVVNGTEDG